MVAITPGRQLVFPFAQADGYAADTFLSGRCNAEALAWLAQPALWPALRLAIHGPQGCGKTHLLHFAVHQETGIIIAGEDVRPLVALPMTGVVAVDDVDCASDEESLLHLLNSAAERSLPVLLASRQPPAHLPIRLPDLASRLRATACVGLGQPDDSLLRALFARLLADRQIAVGEEVQDWLLARLPRTGAALREAACRLDRASLAAGRSIGRLLAARVLEEMERDGA